MLGKRKRKKTGAQVARELTENLTVKIGHISRRSLPIQAICKICIVLFLFSIFFGIGGIVSRANDISKKELHIESLKSELQDLKNQLESKQQFKEKLASDSLSIEAVARSYGMSKKGERAFYFLD
jgi:cell division protein FtsB